MMALDLRTYYEIMNKKTPIPAGFLKHPIHLFALGFGTGCVPGIPGTAGTLVGVIFYLSLRDVNLNLYILIVTILFIIGIWLCGKTADSFSVHDHSAIVWDEIVGYLITMIAAPPGWAWILAGFILFRLFDITKPWPIRWADQKIGGGFGIMLDDVIAGIYGLVILQIAGYLL